MFCNASANLSAAGFINAQCEGTLTANGKARFAPASLQSSPARVAAVFVPAITTWPGELKFTAETISPVSLAACSHALMIASFSKPIIANIAPVPAGTACCIALPRSSTNLIASWKSNTPAHTNAEYSPKL